MEHGDRPCVGTAQFCIATCEGKGREGRNDLLSLGQGTVTRTGRERHEPRKETRGLHSQVLGYCCVLRCLAYRWFLLLFIFPLQLLCTKVHVDACVSAPPAPFLPVRVLWSLEAHRGGEGVVVWVVPWLCRGGGTAFVQHLLEVAAQHGGPGHLKGGHVLAVLGTSQAQEQRPRRAPFTLRQGQEATHEGTTRIPTTHTAHTACPDQGK